MVEHQRLEGEYYKTLLSDGTLEEHLTRMAQGGTAMDETEALAYSELAQCPLDIWVMPDGVFGFHRVTPALERMRPPASIQPGPCA